MTFTLWSHGELLGESALDYVRVWPRLRTGDLHVTPKGLKVIERLTQTRADAYSTARRLCNERSPNENDESLKSLHADLAAQHDQNEALALELRAPDGSVIPTERIDVSDTEYLLGTGHESDDDDDFGPEDVLNSEGLDALGDQLADLEEDRPPWLPDAPEREPTRFQLSVTLKDEWSIP